MRTFTEMQKYFQTLVDGRAVYVWGANYETITEEMMDRLYKTYGNSQYNRAYYDAKLKEGAGRIGADCSGSFYPMSGYDTTANGYYNKCVEKGTISSLPKSIPCMVFIRQDGKMVHVGWYDGAGKVFEMRSSKMNVRYDALSSRWTHWGKPDFVQYVTEEKEQEGKKIMVELDELRKGSKGAQVKAVQRLLISMGYSCGRSGVDGDMGTNTVKAVKRYQSENKLVSDGIVGKNTWGALLGV